MAFGSIPDWLKDSTYHRRRRSQREHEGRVKQPSVPYGSRNHPGYSRSLHQGRIPQPSIPAGPRNTPGYNSQLHRGLVPQPLSTPDDGNALLDTLSSAVSASPLGSVLDSPVNQAASGIVEDEAKRAGANALDVVREKYPGVFNSGDLPGQEDLGKQLEGSADAAVVAAPELSGIKGASKAAEVARTVADAATGESKAARAVRALAGGKGPVRSAAEKVAAKVEPDAVKGAREAVADKASALPKSVKVGGRTAGRAASYPIRHPFTSPVAAQVPFAIAHKESPGDALTAALSGQGAFADISGGIAKHVPGVVGEAVNLPASILPSTFLTGKAGVSAAQGNTDEAKALWDEWKKTGLLPAIASGDPGEALKRLLAHPLYSGLEASGALNVLGRGLGKGLRSVPGTDIAGLERPSEVVRGAGVERKRGYSRDAFRQAGQKAAEKALPKHFGEDVQPNTLRARRIEKEAANRFSAGSERIRKKDLQNNLKVLNNLLPRKGPKVRVKGTVIGKIDRRTSEVVNLAVERLIQSPETFHGDIEHYKAMVDSAREEKQGNGDYVLNRAQRRANKAISDQLEGALKVDSPHRVEATVNAANEFIRHQKDQLQEMVDHKFLTPEQAEKASLIPFARVHMGTRYGVPKEHQPHIDEKAATVKSLEAVRENAIHDGASAESIDAITKEVQKAKRSHENAHEKHSSQIDNQGNAVSREAIKAEMERRGIEPPGFLSHREASSGDFFRPTRGGGKLDNATRTGLSAAAGAHLGGVESLVRQVARSTNLLHRAKTWNRAIDEFGLEVKGIDTAKEAKAVIDAPEDHGFPANTELVAVPRHPFGAPKAQREGAIEHQNPKVMDALEHTDPTQAGEAADKLLHDEIERGLNDELDPDAQVVLMPRKVGEQFSKDAEASPGYIRGFQAFTNLFKRAVLPFSPGFYIGNVFDNYMRTALAGINPFHFVVGQRAIKSMKEAKREELAAGAHFSSVENLAPHRSVESILKGADPLSKGIRASAEWSRKHGWKQAAVKFAPNLLKQGTHYLLATNAFISEDLPQRGAIGKLALAEMAKTQGSWTKAIWNFKDAADDFAKGVEDRGKMVKAQKDLEETFGNYANMSPDARRLLGTITPFWTWMRAAYKFAYITMPLHHSIATGVLAGLERATQDEREQWGLDKTGKDPLPNYLQGALPWPKGAIVPFGNYNSFGYASDPLDAVARVVLPQVLSGPEALGGIDWKGDPIESESDRLRAAAFAFAGSILPGWNTLVHEAGDKVEVGPKVNLPHVEDGGYVQYKRQPTQTITVPKSGSSSGSSGTDYGNVFSGGSGSSVDYGSVFSGGN